MNFSLPPPIEPAPASTGPGAGLVNTRALRIWAALPLAMEILWTCFDHGLGLYRWGGTGRLYQVFLPAVIAGLILLLLFLPDRRRRLLGCGVYLAHAWYSITISTIRMLVMFNSYAIQSGWLWFAYNTTLVICYGIGAWQVWRLCRAELAAAAHAAPAPQDEPDPWQTTEKPERDSSGLAARIQDRRFRLWALAAPGFMLVLVPAIQLAFQPVFWNPYFLATWLMECILCLLLAIGFWRDRSMEQILSAGGCGYFAATLGFHLIGEGLRGDGWTYSRILAPFEGPFSFKIPSQIFFYTVLVVVVGMGLRASVFLVARQVKQFEAGRDPTGKDAGEDDLAGSSNWDEASKK